jgi:hypothetical protein
MSAIPVSQRSTLEEPRILPWIALLRSFAGHFFWCIGSRLRRI